MFIGSDMTSLSQQNTYNKTLSLKNPVLQQESKEEKKETKIHFDSIEVCFFFFKKKIISNKNYQLNRHTNLTNFFI